jgi:UDP-N-acetylglucosamine kinase
MDLTEQQERIKNEALKFARKNKKAIGRRLTNPGIFVAEDHPVSVFMAGSPGAGKTETSKELLASLEKDRSKVLRIEPDELRCEFAGYTGANSWLFQPAISILVEKIHDLALDQKQSFLFDGTLSHYDVAKKNIKRSLGKGRTVQILYVYQEPLLAWEFVCAREAAEGRRIPPEHFIEQYFAARDVVNRSKREFGPAIKVDLLLKNNDGSSRFYKAGVDQIDYHIPEKYDRVALEKMLGLP